MNKVGRILLRPFFRRNITAVTNDALGERPRESIREKVGSVSCVNINLKQTDEKTIE